MISDIEIRLRADIARLQQDMDRARQSVGGALDKINGAVSKTNAALSGLAVGAAAVSFLHIIKGSIDAADALNDLSARTQVSIEDLAGLDYAARLTGTSLDGVAGAVNKLSTNIGKDAEKFRELGVTAQDPVEALGQLADIFRSIQDPQQRAAFGAAALGKSWAEVAPLLDEGSAGIAELVAKGKDLSGVTEQVAREAGVFNDRIDELAFAARGAALSFAAEFLPVINKVTEGFVATEKAADGAASKTGALQAAFKDLVVVGGAVGLVFDLTGKTLAAIVGQVTSLGGAVFNLLQLDFKGFVSNLRQIPGIGRAFLDDSANAIEGFAAWEQGIRNVGAATTAAGDDITKFIDEVDKAIASGANAAQVQAFIKQQEATGQLTKAANDAASAAKRQQEAYTSLITTLREKQAVQLLEIRTGEAASESDKARIKLDQDLASGKLVLTKSQEAEVRALMGAIASQQAYIEASKQVNAALEAINKERADAVRAAEQEAEAQEKLVAEYGMTKRAIDAATLARLEEQLAQRSSLGLTLDEIEQLEKLIAAKRRSAEAGQTLEALENQKKATEQASAEQIAFWQSIDRTAHDTFVSILDGGKGLAQRLKDTLKNTFFDWLYQMTLKKWIINIGASVTGSAASGLASAAGGAVGGGAASGLAQGLGIGGALATLGGIGAGAAQTAGALLAGNIGIGSTLGAGFSAIGTGSLSGIAAGLSSVVGVVAPLAIGAVLASSVFKKAFGRGPREVTSQGITGTFGADGFMGQAFEEWVKKGGWFRSDKRGTDTKPIDAALQATLTDAYAAIKDATSSYAAALGLPTESIKNFSSQLRLVWTGDQAKDQQAVADALANVSDELAVNLLPNLADFAVKGETASTTLQRIATNYTTLDAVLTSLGDDFGAVGISSLAARERLIQLAGGIDSLAANAQVFAQNFLTEAERLAPVQEAVTKRLAELGLSSVTTRDQFRDAVFAIDKTTEAGAKQYAALLQLAGAFAQVTEGAANAAEASRQAVRDAFAGLQKSVDARREQLKSTYEANISALDQFISSLQSRIEALKQFAETARGLASNLGAGAQTGAQAAASSRQARQQLADLVSAAQRTGRLPQQELVQQLAAAAQRAGQGQFNTFEEFQRAQFQTAADLGALASVADKQAIQAQSTLGILQLQKAAADAAYLREQEQLDALIENAQKQVDVALGTLDAIKSIPEAIQSLAAALSGAAGAGRGATGIGPGGVAVDSSLQAFWEFGQFDFFRNGVPAFANGGMHGGGARIVGEFGKELEVTGPARYYSAKQTSTMMGESNSEVVEELRVLNNRMQVIEQGIVSTARNTGRTAYSSDQLARQFDQVSGGGNALATEQMG